MLPSLSCRPLFAALALAGAVHNVHAQSGPTAPAAAPLPALATNTALPEPVTRLMQAAHIPLQAAGIVVLRGDTAIVAHNAGQVMQPASTMKLLTTLAALEQLGPVFRGRTELRSSAPVTDGVLQGDLLVRGGADADFNEDVLRHMLQALRTQGINTIAGDVVLDRQLFQPARTDTSQPFDEYPWAYYNVVPNALLVNTNLLKLDIRSVGGRQTIIMLPELDNVSVRSEMTASHASCAQWEQGWRTPEYLRNGERIEVVLRGSFPRDCVRTVSVNVLDPHDYLAGLVRAEWRKLGGTLLGQVREAPAPLLPAGTMQPATVAAAASSAHGTTTAGHDAMAGAAVDGGRANGTGAAAAAGAATNTGTAVLATSAGTAMATANSGSGATAGADTAPSDAATRLLAEHVSRALPEVLRDINKNSDNTLARALFLSLGSLQADPLLGSRPLPADGLASTTQARAEGAIRNWLQQQGIASTGLVLDNGSGLSRSERATPAQLAGVLQAGLRSNWMPEFLSSLPIAATDGTMRRRLKDSPAASRARLKTGSLNGVIAIAGYVPDATNQPVVVVALLNDPHVANGAGRAVLDALVDWVARQ